MHRIFLFQPFSTSPNSGSAAADRNFCHPLPSHLCRGRKSHQGSHSMGLQTIQRLDAIHARKSMLPRCTVFSIVFWLWHGGVAWSLEHTVLSYFHVADEASQNQCFVCNVIAPSQHCVLSKTIPTTSTDSHGMCFATSSTPRASRAGARAWSTKPR